MLKLLFVWSQGAGNLHLGKTATAGIVRALCQIAEELDCIVVPFFTFLYLEEASAS
jgi:hypothetical protein